MSQVCGYFIPISVKEEVVRRYAAKESQVAIAVAMGLRRAVVHRILVEGGVSLRIRRPASEEHRKAILKMHAGGKRIREISLELGLNFTTVYRILRRAGRVKRKRS